MLTQLWVGTYHGSHDGTRVVVTTTRDDEQPLLYGLECTCGLSQRYAAPVSLDRAAWRHTHPTFWDRWRQKLTALRHAFRLHPEQEPTR
ncbi:hypothetical protein [Streptomyces chartreusis]|uniref:Uncharacterized protein n=1 Tax=Streptomyces chartreusis TaxID=1969 RepID=A0A7H8T6D1_STRCX|nr:hypothetical protein [Streptomyces chartreusis]QKZ18602.1 hypothetical protein HUT05_15225 [Streptomyces chartreusis]